MDFINRLLGKKKEAAASNTTAPPAASTDADFIAVTSHAVVAEQATPRTGPEASGVGGLPPKPKSSSRPRVPDGLHLSGAAALSSTSTAAASFVPVPSLAATSAGAAAAAAADAGTPAAPLVTVNGHAVPNVSSWCPKEKWQYERCFQRWYTAEYLTGKSTDLSSCALQFDIYRACVIDHYQKNDPDVLLLASGTSDRLLTQEGIEGFNTKYPKLDANTKPK